MICKNCGQENADGLTFCQHCGKRLDGKKICPVCGAKIDEEAKFCGVCGADLESADSEVAAASATVAEDSRVATPKPLDKEKVKKIVDLTGLVLVLFAAFMGVIFTFLIGFKVSGGEQSQTTMLYTYFEEVYEQIDLNYRGAELTAIESALIYMPSVIGTLVSAGAIISTIVFTVLTGLEANKKFAKKQENTKLAKYATATYISYAVSATVFLAINASVIKTSKNGIGSVARYGFSDATLAGLILGGIALGGYYCCKIANNLQEYKNNKTLISSIVALVTAVFAIVVTALVASPVASFEFSINSGYATYYMNISGGYSFACGYCLGYGAEDAQSITIIITSLLGTLSQIAIIAASAIALIKFANAACGNCKERKWLAFAITSFVACVANLVCAIITAKTIVEIMGGEELTVGYGATIALVVLSALVLAGSIVYKIFSSKSNTEEIQPETVS